jgi:phosphoserine phosphatase
MRELLDLLESSGFRVFICSAGGRDFVRPVSEQIYGIPRERVIGSSAPLELRDGALVRLPGAEQPIDDGPGKPVHIWARTGRRPLFAAGNANGDFEMLSAARFGLLVLHNDAEREFDYTAGAERSLEAAAAQGWTVAGIKNDWKAVFG